MGGVDCGCGDSVVMMMVLEMVGVLVVIRMMGECEVVTVVATNLLDMVMVMVKRRMVEGRLMVMRMVTMAMRMLMVLMVEVMIIMTLNKTSRERGNDSDDDDDVNRE